VTANGPKIHTIEGEAQRRAFSSPLRQEILTFFASGRSLSVREVAELMGRPPSAIHYHVRLLVQSGLLVKSGERREGRRREAEYSRVAEAIAVPPNSQSLEEGDHTLALETIASGFRMAERDIKAALSGGTARREGDDRNFYAIRAHLRLSQREMAELNRRLNALLGVVLESMRREQPSDEDEFVSLTLALVPLPNRSAGSS
jgi:DNA-binding MarR family transcriptional regulator